MIIRISLSSCFICSYLLLSILLNWSQSCWNLILWCCSTLRFASITRLAPRDGSRTKFLKMFDYLQLLSSYAASVVPTQSVFGQICGFQGQWISSRLERQSILVLLESILTFLEIAWGEEISDQVTSAPRSWGAVLAGRWHGQNYGLC